MKRAIVSAVTVLVLLAIARPSEAQSTPFIDVDTFGIELCPQSVCGAAIFAGILHGQVGNNPHAFGTFAVAITHDTPLPEEGDPPVALTGGVFEFRIGLRRIRGIVAGGLLSNDGGNTFLTRAVLVLTSGGAGTVVYEGALDHNVFPPTVIGRVFQPGS